MQRSINIMICAAMTLVALGTVAIFATLSVRGSELSVGVFYLLKQLVWVIVGAGGLWCAARFDYRLLQRYWGVIAGVTLVCLVVVLIPGVGTYMYGSRRWLRLGPIGFQPSEMAKLALVITLAAIAVRFEGRQHLTLKHVGIMLGVVGVTSILVLAEPDFSTTALLAITGMAVIVAANVPLMPVVGSCAAGGIGLAFMLTRSAHRMARVKVFLEPLAHRGSKAGYQPFQSLVALGSGGFTGRSGLPRPGFLPQSDTDFILANIGEGIGLIGTLGVLFLFLLIIRQGFAISERAADSFGRLLAFGITAFLALQALIHIAVVTVSMPTTGIALPFVSSGGSSLLAAMVAVGLLISVARRAGDGLMHEPASDWTASDIFTPATASERPHGLGG
jgi:cell division protein FtsW